MGELENVGTPIGAGVDPSRQGLGEGGEIEEEVLGLAELGSGPGGLGTRVQQIGRVELTTTVITLVTAGIVVPTDRAGALDVTVWQGAAGGRLESTHLGLLDDVAVLVEAGEDLLGDVSVVVRHRRGVQVVGQAKALQVRGDDAVILLGALLGRETLLISLDRDGGAVAIRAGDHENSVTRHSHVPGKDVRGDTESGHMADMSRPIGVGPRDGGKNVGTHGAKSIGTHPRGRIVPRPASPASVGRHKWWWPHLASR